MFLNPKTNKSIVSDFCLSAQLENIISILNCFKGKSQEEQKILSEAIDKLKNCVEHIQATSHQDVLYFAD
jgi:hypothetical protein